MLLFAGLGNPGAKHAGNRHNVGFLAIDEIAARHGFGPFKSRFSGQAAEGQLAGEKLLLLKPMTYMNDSGRSVGAALRYHKLKPAQVVVFYDELDLAPGKVRVRTGGGIAGHNGLRSIRSHIGPDFRRVRIGIGHPGDKARVHSHVLRDFPKADRTWLEPLLDGIGSHADLLVKGQDNDFMSKLAQDTAAPRAGAAGKAQAPKPPRDNSAPQPGTAAFTETLRTLRARLGEKKN
jgi:PTH1 family peptidyl-tRNA hydrolase